MKFIRATHVFDSDETLVTFGIDEHGKIWLVTNTDGKAEGIETEYFGFSVNVFRELVTGLIKLAFAALRFKFTGNQFTDDPDEEYMDRVESGIWYGTGISADGVIFASNAVSAYPHMHESDGTVEGCPGCFPGIAPISEKDD